MADLDMTRHTGVLLRHWRKLAGVGLLAVVLSAIFSGPTFIRPLYRSTAVVYPVNLTSYSIETRTDQLLQLLGSNSIRDSLIRRFDLPTRYRIDTTRPPGKFYLHSEYEDRVSITKTRYESVVIDVTDEDPRVARDMVVEVLRQTDLLARRLQREKSLELLAIAEREMRIERAKVDSVEQRLAELRKATGLLNYDAQTEEITRGYMRLLAGGNPQGREEARNMLRTLGERGGEFRELTDLGNIFRYNYAGRLNEYQKALTDVTKELTYTNVVVGPEVADKKVFPIRWLIVLISLVSALLLAAVLVLWREQVGRS